MDGGDADLVHQILKRDPEGREKAPRVIQDDLEPSTSGAGAVSADADDGLVQTSGLKFGMPELPLPSQDRLKFRYDPVIQQVTNLLMRDGKLAVAQTVGLSVPRSWRRTGVLGGCA